MHANADTMIALLADFRSDPDDVENVIRLDRITAEFGALNPQDKRRVVPAMFAVMERYPDADLGSPGPLVHSIETLPVDQYEPELVRSVRRRPMYLNLWMVNRILNVTSDEGHRAQLLDLLRGALSSPWGAEVSKIASGFLDHQAREGAE